MRLVMDFITSVLFDMAPATLIMAEDNQGRGRGEEGHRDSYFVRVLSVPARLPMKES